MIEPEARYYQPSPDGQDNARAWASIAISFRRIADAAERMARSLEEATAEARASAVARQILEEVER